ncbi:MAG: S8 family serine peptidase [Mycobacteriales bacterium]
MRGSRLRRSGAGLTAGLAVLLPVLVSTGSAHADPSTLTPGQATQLARNPDTPVIVLLKNQHPDLPARQQRTARTKALRSDQSPVVDELHQVHAGRVHQYATLNAVSATVSKAEASHLATKPGVAAVVPDLPVRRPAEQARAAAPAAAVPPAQAAACTGDPARPQLEPEALQLTHTAYDSASQPQAANLATGEGVKVAFLADGIDVHNPDFQRADGSPVFADYQDFTSEGPDAPSDAAEAFGDASAIAAQGLHTYDVADWSASGVTPTGCTIRIRGMAPGASLVGLKVFGSQPTAPSSRFIQAIDYAVNVANVDVINESFGANPYPDRGTDPISLADDAAVAAGVTVVASTGDSGTNGTIGSPASDPNVISAAATTQFRSYAQISYGGINVLPARSWASDNISSLSSGGVTERGRTVDIAAPGDLGWALCSPGDTYEGCAGHQIQDFGGTSQSAPLTSGAAALVIEAYERAHHGVRPAPALVKQILTSTAQDLGHPSYEQGAGLLDAYRAVRLALSVHDGNGHPAAQGDGLVVPTQLTATATAGSGVDFTARVTNGGARAQALTGSLRGFGKPAQVTRQTLTIDAQDKSAPSFVDGYGFTRAYTTTSFTVPAGADRLEAEIALPDGAFTGYGGSSPRFGLIDPAGVYQAFSLPQGLGDYGHVDVRYPAGGTWQVVLFATRSATGYKGRVTFAAQVSHATTLGSVSPARLTLAPGETRTVKVHLTAPANPGDLSASLQLANGFGHATSVPVTVRSLVRLDRRGGTFTDTLTGGNGRGGFGAVGQGRTYAFDVPRGVRDMGVGITFPDPETVLDAYLIGPDGQIASAQSTDLVDAAGNENFTGALQLWRTAPAAGRWHLTVVLANPVSGLELSQPMTAHVSFDAVKVKASGLPAGGTLEAGKPVTATVSVTNTGVAPELFFLDPRLDSRADLTLVGSHTTGLALPVPVGTQPAWSVPTQTDGVTFASAATLPADLDVAFAPGEPELYGPAHGTTASVHQSAAEVSAGPWWAFPEEVGPYAGPAPTGSIELTGVAHTRRFDTSVTSSTGDVWLGSVTASTPAATPLLVAPGQTATITVTVTPVGAKGSTVHGTLFVDDFNYGSGLTGNLATTSTGSELAGLPYAYRVG